MTTASGTDPAAVPPPPPPPPPAEDDEAAGPPDAASVWAEIARQTSRTAVPTILERLLNRVPWLLTLHVIGYSAPSGNDGDGAEMAAAALATTITNVVGLSLVVGLSMCGITTLVGQAKGSLRVSREGGDGGGGGGVVGGGTADEGAPLLRRTAGRSPPADPADGDLLLVYLYRALSVHLAVSVPVGALWLVPGPTSYALSLLGQDPRLALLTERYMRRLAPGLWAFSVYFTLSTWFTSVEMAHIPPRAIAAGVALHIPTVLWSVRRFGYLGGAVSTSAYQVVVAALISAYLWRNKELILLEAVRGKGGRRKCRRSRVEGDVAPSSDSCRQEQGSAGWARTQTDAEARGGEMREKGNFSHLEISRGRSYPESSPESRSSLSARARGRDTLSLLREAACSPSGLRQYLALSLPGVILISEWWASEVAIFLAGTLSPAHVTAMSIYQTLVSVCFQFAIGMGAGASTRVANNLGAGRVRAARVSAAASVLSVLGVSLALGALLFLAPHGLYPSLFDRDRLVIDEVARCVPWLCVYVVGDGVTYVLGGILRACGRQGAASPVIVVAYWAVGLPLGYHLTFRGACGGPWGVWDSGGGGVLCSLRGHTAGLVAGMCVGTWTHMTLFAVLVYWTDWKGEAVRARKRTARPHLDEKIESE